MKIWSKKFSWDNSTKNFWNISNFLSQNTKTFLSIKLPDYRRVVYFDNDNEHKSQSAQILVFVEGVLVNIALKVKDNRLSNSYATFELLNYDLLNTYDYLCKYSNRHVGAPSIKIWLGLRCTHNTCNPLYIPVICTKFSGKMIFHYVGWPCIEISEAA